MSLLPYSLARPFLFGLDPETAHELTMQSLARLQGTPLEWAYCNGMVDDPIELAGLQFPNRVGLAAGLDKNARCIDGAGRHGLRLRRSRHRHAQAAARQPQAAHVPPAAGQRADQPPRASTTTAWKPSSPTCKRSSLSRRRAASSGLNIGKNAATPIENATNDYLVCLDGVYPHADYVTINISSPNTSNLRTLQSDEALDALLGAIARQREALAAQHGRRVPIFVKIAPDLDEAQIEVIAATLQAPRHGRRDRHQHHHQPRRGRRACRTPRKPAA